MPTDESLAYVLKNAQPVSNLGRVARLGEVFGGQGQLGVLAVFLVRGLDFRLFENNARGNPLLSGYQ